MSARLWFHPATIADYAISATVRVRRGARGHRHHAGSAEQVIRRCVDACWNGRTFTASPGHFRQFWTRDLCFSAPSLARLGPRDGDRARASLAWALGVWERRRSHITTTIHTFTRPVDVYDYGVDSLPLLLAALASLGADDLVERHRGWISDEVGHYADRVIDPAIGLVRADRTFSAHRDTVTNRCNAYGNSMTALLSRVLAATGWAPDPLARWLRDDPSALLIRHFWRGRYFADAPDDAEISGEGCIWPFWTGVVRDPAMLAASLHSLTETGYTLPYPLRYEAQRQAGKEVLGTRLLAPNYQGSTSWTSIGAMFLQLQRRSDPAAADVGIAAYRALIERDGTYWEVLDADGRCYESPTWVMIGEESMLWSSIFLDLLRHPDGPRPLLS